MSIMLRTLERTGFTIHIYMLVQLGAFALFLLQWLYSTIATPNVFIQIAVHAVLPTYKKNTFSKKALVEWRWQKVDDAKTRNTLELLSTYSWVQFKCSNCAQLKFFLSNLVLSLYFCYNRPTTLILTFNLLLDFSIYKNNTFSVKLLV